MKIICKKRYVKISYLAAEFGVSERTIRRDIENLSLNEPIYTQPGRYNGGVYVVDGYYLDKNYINKAQSDVLMKVIQMAEKREVCILSPEDIGILNDLLNYNTKPTA